MFLASTKNFKPGTSDQLACSHCGKNHVKQEALDKLQAMRDELGEPMTVTSGYRCIDHPDEKGRAHNAGEAFDIACSDGEKRRRLVELALKHGVKGIGVGADFVHFDWWGKRKRLGLWGY